MADTPKTGYAKAGNVHIAYQLVGDGPIDIVLVPNWITHVEAMWEIPSIARYLKRFSSFSRVIAYDQQGTGMSDPVSLAEPPPMEQRMDEVLAVLDAAGSDRAAIIGFESGGPMAMLFAATYPERTQALCVINSFSRILGSEDYEHGLPEDFMTAFFDGVLDTWGTTAPAPGSEPGPEDVLWAWYQRQAASPGAVRAMVNQIKNVDVRHVLPAIRVPTLVLTRENPLIQAAAGRPLWTLSGRYIAERIPGAQIREIATSEEEPDLNLFLDDIREFLTGVRAAPEEHDRVLATVMFSDIVASTETAARLGDRRWKELLDAHDQMIRRQLERFRGTEVKALGDGFLATFDGPARAIACATAVRDSAHRLGIEVRIGLHTGEIELRGDDVGGIAVHIAARVASEAGPSEIVVSRTVTDLVAGSGLQFAERGSQELKGIPGEWQLFAVR